MRWPQIYAANRDLIQDPDLIYPGQRLVLSAPAFPMPPAGVYRVLQGDSLWKIAARTYGNPWRWPLIHEANRDRIRNPDLIFPNQQLIIPKDSPKTQP